MLKRIAEFGMHVGIVGFRDVSVGSPDGLLRVIDSERPENVCVQVFDADFIASWQHVFFAVVNALTAFQNGENISKSLSMETMLYASGCNQIKKATELVGIKSSSANLVVLAVGHDSDVVRSTMLAVSECIKGEVDDEIIGLSESKMRMMMKVFGISDAEIGTVVEDDDAEKVIIDLLIERMALLPTHR
jgi:tRNA threonylcarbamoyladenosine modification (KEOPS) complex Cgi121 subunit